MYSSYPITRVLKRDWRVDLLYVKCHFFLYVYDKNDILSTLCSMYKAESERMQMVRHIVRPVCSFRLHHHEYAALLT